MSWYSTYFLTKFSSFISVQLVFIQIVHWRDTRYSFHAADTLFCVFAILQNWIYHFVYLRPQQNWLHRQLKDQLDRVLGNCTVNNQRFLLLNIEPPNTFKNVFHCTQNYRALRAEHCMLVLDLWVWPLYVLLQNPHSLSRNYLLMTNCFSMAAESLIVKR